MGIIRQRGLRRPQIYPYLNMESAGLDIYSSQEWIEITPSATANTKGAWVELIAATARQTRAVTVSMLGKTSVAAHKSWLVDFARSATVTITIASPGVITWAGHGLVLNQQVSFTTSSALPTGLVAGTTYFAIPVSADTFQVSATAGGAAINTSGSQSGVHTGYAIIIPNLLSAKISQYNLKPILIRFPLNIAAGTRIVARCQSNMTSGDNMGVSLLLEDGVVGASGIDSLNASVTTSFGTAVTPGSSAESAYVQLIAATAREYMGFFAIFDSQGSAGANYRGCNDDFAIGGAGSEVVFFPNFIMYDGVGDIFPWQTLFYRYRIPAGSRVAVRSYSNGAANTHGVSLYGVYE